ncbi:MAG: Ig-like domain repeat protein [Nocardioides sp.]
MATPARVLARALALVIVTATIALGTGGPSSADGPGELVGTLTTSDGGDISGVVTLHHWDAGSSTYVDETSVPVDGPIRTTYSFTGLVTDDFYYVSYEDNDDVYRPGFGGGASQPPADTDDLGAVQLGSNGATSNISLRPVATPRPVHGTVVTAGGAGIAGVYVVATLVAPSGNRKYADDGSTGAGGRFDLALRPGTYVLDVEDIHQRYANATVQVTMTSTTDEFDPITLVTAQTWTYTGKVVDGGGDPIAGARVQAYTMNGVAGDWWGYDPGPQTTTDSTGTYRFEGLRHNEYYTVGASAYRHPAAALGGATDPTDGTVFRAIQNRTLPNLTLTDATGLRGSVSSVFGSTEDVTMELLRWDESEDAFVAEGSATTDADGAYRFDTLTPGQYALHADAGAADGQLRSAWVGGSEPTGPGSAAVFTVTDTPSEVVRNVTLAPRQVATGVVAGETGTALPGGTITAYTYDGESNAWTAYAHVQSIAGGAFAVPVPADSIVTVRIALSGYQTRFLDGGPSLPPFPTQQNSRQTAADGDVDLGTQELVLTTQQATGVLTTSTGGPLAGGTVTSYTRDGAAWKAFASAPTGADGSFSVPVPSHSTVTFRFARSGYQTRFLGGSSALPTTPTPENSWATGPEGGVDLGSQGLEVAPKATSTTKAKLAKKKIRQGQSTTITITVTAAGVTGPTGKVAIYDGKKRIKNVTLTAGKRGVLTIKLKKPSKGKHKIYASYAGSAQVVGSKSSTVILKVVRR